MLLIRNVDILFVYCVSSRKLCTEMLIYSCIRSELYRYILNLIPKNMKSPVATSVTSNQIDLL